MTSVAIPASITSVELGSTQMALQQNIETSMTKLPWQRMRPAISKYLKMVDIHLHRLHQHQYNMEKMVKAEQWAQLHEEQVRATYTTQQVKATLQELQRARSQVMDNQVDGFHALLQEFKVESVAAVDTFLRFCQGKQPECGLDCHNTEENNSNDNSTVPDTTHACANAQTCVSTYVCSVPDNTCAAASREQLRQETEELHALVLHFVQTVRDIQTKTWESTENSNDDESIENNNSDTGPAASAENKTVNKKTNLKMAVLPVVGALLGGAVAGPVGLVTGIKIGTLAGTVGGGVAGLASGTLFTSQSKVPTKASDGNHKNDNTTKDDLTTIP